MYALEKTIKYRIEKLRSAREDDLETLKKSWTARLLTDPELLCSKIREEADELCKTLEDKEGEERVASEMADLLYHSIALLVKEGVSFEDAVAALRKRMVKSLEKGGGRGKETRQKYSQGKTMNVCAAGGFRNTREGKSETKMNFMDLELENRPRVETVEEM